MFVIIFVKGIDRLLLGKMSRQSLPVDFRVLLTKYRDRFFKKRLESSSSLKSRFNFFIAFVHK